jgi:dihydroorotase
VLQELALPMPDDFHIHLRQGKNLAKTYPLPPKAFSATLSCPELLAGRGGFQTRPEM